MYKLSILPILLIFACQPAPMHPENQYQEDRAKIAEFEVFHGDTCNRKDMLGRKQGKWYSYSNGKKSDTLYYENDSLITPKN
jgi:hypothetical protein